MLHSVEIGLLFEVNQIVLSCFNIDTSELLKVVLITINLSALTVLITSRIQALATHSDDRLCVVHGVLAVNLLFQLLLLLSDLPRVLELLSIRTSWRLAEAILVPDTVVRLALRSDHRFKRL